MVCKWCLEEGSVSCGHSARGHEGLQGQPLAKLSDGDGEPRGLRVFQIIRFLSSFAVLFSLAF